MTEHTSAVDVPGYSPLPSAEERQRLRLHAQEVQRQAQDALQRASEVFSRPANLPPQPVADYNFQPFWNRLAA